MKTSDNTTPSITWSWIEKSSCLPLAIELPWISRCHNKHPPTKPQRILTTKTRNWMIHFLNELHAKGVACGTYWKKRINQYVETRTISSFLFDGDALSSSDLIFSTDSTVSCARSRNDKDNMIILSFIAVLHAVNANTRVTNMFVFVHPARPQTTKSLLERNNEGNHETAWRAQKQDSSFR